jgi:hypothetical protein
MSRVDELIIAAQQRYLAADRERDDALVDRARVFALAQQLHGRSSGDISRLLGAGVTPTKVGSEIRLGRRFLQPGWRKPAPAHERTTA